MHVSSLGVVSERAFGSRTAGITRSPISRRHIGSQSSTSRARCASTCRTTRQVEPLVGYLWALRSLTRRRGRGCGWLSDLSAAPEDAIRTRAASSPRPLLRPRPCHRPSNAGRPRGQPRLFPSGAVRLSLRFPVGATIGLLPGSGNACSKVGTNRASHGRARSRLRRLGI